MRFDLSQGFPLLTTKKVHLKSIIHELLWFLKGDTNIAYLKENGVSIWDEWADANGDLGPIYGYQWRSWPAADGRHIDQISEVVETLKHNPDSRRIIVSAWNVGEIQNMKLPPCHAFFQFYVAGRQVVLPALPAQRRHLPRRAVQHRQLCPADPDDGAGHRPEAGRFRAYPGRCAHLPEPPGTGESATQRATPRALPSMRLNPAVTRYLRFQIRRFHAGKLRPASGHQGAGGGLTYLPSPQAGRGVEGRGKVPNINVIAAMARNRVIGINNTLPWRLPADLQHFKALTMGHHIIMGRKTYESIGIPLPGRTTVIVTRDANYRVEGCLTATSIDAAIAACGEDPEIFFVGGAELYAQVLPLRGSFVSD